MQFWRWSALSRQKLPITKKSLCIIIDSSRKQHPSWLFHPIVHSLRPWVAGRKFSRLFSCQEQFQAPCWTVLHFYRSKTCVCSRQPSCKLSVSCCAPKKKPFRRKRVPFHKKRKETKTMVTMMWVLLVSPCPTEGKARKQVRSHITKESTFKMIYFSVSFCSLQCPWKLTLR